MPSNSWETSSAPPLFQQKFQQQQRMSMPPIDHLGTDQLLVNLTVKPDKHMIRTHFFNVYRGHTQYTGERVKHQNQKPQVEMCSLTLIFFNEN